MISKVLSVTGFQNFQGTVCGSFGMFFQYHCPDSSQRTVDVMEPHGSHSVHIDFCVSHQLRKFFVGHHLAQQPGIDSSAFQKRHSFIGQMQFRQRGVDLLPVFCPALMPVFSTDDVKTAPTPYESETAAAGIP